MSKLFFLPLSLALFFSGATAWAEESYLLSASDLTRLYGILNRYEVNTSILSEQLASSELSLTELGKKLADSERSSTELSQRLEVSMSQSQAQGEALKNLGESMRISEESWKRYADDAEREILRLEKARNLWRLAAVIAGSSAAIELVIHLLR